MNKHYLGIPLIFIVLFLKFSHEHFVCLLVGDVCFILCTRGNFLLSSWKRHASQQDLPLPLHPQEYTPRIVILSRFFCLQFRSTLVIVVLVWTEPLVIMMYMMCRCITVTAPRALAEETVKVRGLYDFKSNAIILSWRWVKKSNSRVVVWQKDGN